MRISVTLALVTAWAVVLVLAFGPRTAAQMGRADDTSPSVAFVEGAGAQVLEGAALFDLHCSACHGDTGLGVAEARLSFPEEERRCARCHRPQNPAQLRLADMTATNAFSIGDPPALRDDDAIGRFGSALALHGYLTATMPRPFPGALADGEYWAITAFLLEINGALPDGVVLGADNAATTTFPTP